MKNTLSITNQSSSIREKLIIVLFKYSKEIYRIFIKRKTKKWDVSIQSLLQYEAGSLGNDLALFLKKNNFEMEPKFEKHDIYHILTDYPTTVLGEVCLSVFNVGNGKRSIYTMGVAVLGSFILFENNRIFVNAYQRGKKARSYAKWQFEFLLHENTQELKKYIFKKENHLELII